MTAGTTTGALKTERLLNLVMVLLYTRRPLTKAQIRRLVGQYDTSPSVEAFERMFERDKDELRALGVPLATTEIGLAFDEEPAYRIDRREYALPDIAFEPDELAVLGLASRTWAQASLAGPAALALRKLESSGVERDTESLVGIEPRLRTVEPAFDAVKDAVVATRPIAFDYRRPEQAEPTARVVEPWSLVSVRGRWYLNAFDRGRGEPRVFRLSRIVGSVRPAGHPGAYAVPEHDPRAMARTRSSAPVDHAPAVLRVRSGAGHALRRRARTVGEVDDTWSLLDLDYVDVEQLADEVCGYGADVVVEAPAELVDAVIARLTAVRDAHRSLR